MAKQIQVVITDDIDGGEAHETIAFGLDGSSLEIDLNKLNAAQFRKTVAPYIEHGRRVSRARARAAGPARDRGHSSDVREWARQQGIKVSERGRIPASVVADYEAAHEDAAALDDRVTRRLGPRNRRMRHIARRAMRERG